MRRTLSPAVDRWEASRELSPIALLKEVGGFLRPGSEFAASEAELTKLAGFGKDIEALRREARRLLKEAGVPEGFSFTFKYQKQSRATDPADRRRLICEFERIVLDEKAYQFPALWNQRIILHWAKVKGWRITPSQYVNQDLRDVWLAE